MEKEIRRIKVESLESIMLFCRIEEILSNQKWDNNRLIFDFGGKDISLDCIVNIDEKGEIKLKINNIESKNRNKYSYNILTIGSIVINLLIILSYLYGKI